jgi:hypothetical protein
MHNVFSDYYFFLFCCQLFFAMSNFSFLYLCMKFSIIYLKAILRFCWMYIFLHSANIYAFSLLGIPTPKYSDPIA